MATALQHMPSSCCRAGLLLQAQGQAVLHAHPVSAGTREYSSSLHGQHSLSSCGCRVDWEQLQEAHMQGKALQPSKKGAQLAAGTESKAR